MRALFVTIDRPAQREITVTKSGTINSPSYDDDWPPGARAGTLESHQHKESSSKIHFFGENI